MKDRERSPRMLFPGGFFYSGESVTADSLLLASFVGRPPRRGVDLGCGSGILTLLLLWEYPSVIMDALDLRSAALEQLELNLRENGWEQRCRRHQGDLRTAALPSGGYDLVISNPPYFPAGRGRPSPSEDRRLMREETASLPELCRTAARLLKEDGRFYLVHIPSRRGELMEALVRAGLSAARERHFSPRPGAAPSLIFMEAQKAACSTPVLLPTLYQYGADGLETEEYRRYTHWEA